MINKKSKCLIVCTVVVSMFSIQQYPIHAAEGSSTTIVSVDYTDEDVFKLEVHIGEGGKVLQGTSILEKGVVVYNLPLDTKKTFTLIPNEGYKIKSVVYERPEYEDSQDVTNKIENSMISVDIESTEMKLYIEFEKVEEEVEQPEVDKPIEETEKPNQEVEKPKNEVQTGDQTKMGYYTSLMALAGVLLIVMKKKRQDEEEN